MDTTAINQTDAVARIAKNNASLNELVHHTLASYIRVPVTKIVVPRNADKYHENQDRTRKDVSLKEIFNLMWRLNVIGLEDGKIGNSTHHVGSLLMTLNKTVQDLAQHLGHHPVQYTELGPEPAKTKYIINELINGGARVERYTSVDINPWSSHIMRDQLSGIIDTGIITHEQSLFEELASVGYRIDGTRNLVTMLGFEEGNDHPWSVALLLDLILDPGDIFLSEMQLLSPTGWSPIYNFYQSDLMRRFSRVCFKRNYGDRRSEYGIYLIPVKLSNIGVPTMVAVTTETIVGDESDLNGLVFVTNYCIKFSADEYVAAREAPGFMKVLSQNTSADGSLAFQISQRL
jgi:hypothetical protein